MRAEDYTTFKNKMVGLGELYNRKISDALLDIYWIALEGISVECFIAGIQRHIQDSKQGSFFPKPANILCKEDQQDEFKRMAELCWEQVMLCASGRHVEIVDCKAMAAINALGGIRKIGLTSYKDLVWLKKEFIASYAMYGNTPVDQLPEHVADLLANNPARLSNVLQLAGAHSE